MTKLKHWSVFIETQNEGKPDINYLLSFLWALPNSFWHYLILEI
jgi:hypothetical protein